MMEKIKIKINGHLKLNFFTIFLFYFLQAMTVTRRVSDPTSQRVQWDLQVTLAVVFGRRQVASAHVDLHRWHDQNGHG